MSQFFLIKIVIKVHDLIRFIKWAVVFLLDTYHFSLNLIYVFRTPIDGILQFLTV